MSLDFDLSRIVDRLENYPPDEHGYTNKMTSRLIWSTLSVRIGEITQKNAPEFYARLSLLESVNGVEKMTKMADVWGHVGLRTNVLTATSATWKKWFMQQHFDPALMEMGAFVRTALSVSSTEKFSLKEIDNATLDG